VQAPIRPIRARAESRWRSPPPPDARLLLGAVIEAADAAYNAARRWGNDIAHGDPDAAFYTREAEYDEAHAKLLDAIRVALAIPEDSDRR
jgi:hypothetical protein